MSDDQHILRTIKSQASNYNDKNNINAQKSPNSPNINAGVSQVTSNLNSALRSQPKNYTEQNAVYSPRSPNSPNSS